MERDLSTFVRTCLLPVSGFHTRLLVGGGGGRHVGLKQKL